VKKRRIHSRVAIGLLTRRPWLVFEELPRRIVFVDTPQTVRRSPRQVTEERFVFILPNEAFRFLEDCQLSVCFAFVESFALVARKWNFLTVANQILRIKGVSVNLVVVAEEFIEAMLLGNALCAATADAPLAESAGHVA
jgi:hypothetical protein